MNIVVTYDPSWKYTPKDQSPSWTSLDTVQFVADLISNIGYEIILIEADDLLEVNLIAVEKGYPDTLVFWLNEFMPMGSGREIFTVEIIEKTRLMHTGPSSKALGIGLNKEATKNVFRMHGLPTPQSYVVYPGDFSTIHQTNSWNGFALIKPLLQGNSRGMDDSSVVPAEDFESIQKRVERIHEEFNEPALVEEYIGGIEEKEYTAPVIISFDGRLGYLPLTEIDLTQLPAAQGNFRFLTNAMKNNMNYLKIPADLSNYACDIIRSDVRKIIKTIGCKDFARIDMRFNSTGLYYVEVNVNPGKNNSSLNMAANSLGYSYEQIIAFIPYQAIQKYGFEPKRKLEKLVYPITTLLEMKPIIEGLTV